MYLFFFEKLQEIVKLALDQLQQLIIGARRQPQIQLRRCVPSFTPAGCFLAPAMVNISS